ncbi:MAG: efflux RND transporter periplasmic adaptor subunit [Pseudomonadota bacterium]
MIITKRITFTALLTALLFSVIAEADNAPVVSVAAVEETRLSPAVRVTGHVQSRYQTELSSGVAGVVDWTAEEGKHVKQGDAVAKLDTTQLKLTEQRLAVQVKRQKVELNRLMQEYNRLTRLKSSNLVSEQVLEGAKVDKELAEADLQLLMLEQQQAQDSLNKALVKAPFSGIIAKRYVRAGQAVGSTSELIKLVSLKELEVKLHGPLSYSRYLDSKYAVEVHFSDGRTLLPVRAVVAVSDERSQTFTAYLDIPKQQLSRFDIGQVVSVSVPSAKEENYVSVPRDALVIKSSGYFVYKLDSENKAHKISVEVTQGVGERVGVTGNLDIGEKVIVRGAETLRDGTVVKILTAHEFPLAS